MLFILEEQQARSQGPRPKPSITAGAVGEPVPLIYSQGGLHERPQDGSQSRSAKEFKVHRAGNGLWGPLYVRACRITPGWCGGCIIQNDCNEPTSLSLY